MRTLLPLFIILFWTLTAQAQNTPCTAIPLSNNMPDFQTYSTAGLNNSGVPYPGCGAPVSVDIWFAVTAPPSGDMDIATLSGTMFNAAMAVYLGPCSNLTQIACTDDDNCGNTIMPVMEFNTLIPGQTYYIRVWPEGGGGTFQIRVTNGPAPQPPINMTTTGSAVQTGPGCIQLTPNTGNQAGCAWETTFADFSQPFTNTYILNFGNSDAGADGICMIYHNDPAGSSACGGTGGDIAAAGIQNSLIIEFDTWDNGAAPPFSDIPQDHVSVAVNGVLGPTIQGPVSLGNIEDGQDHEVMFSWNPVGNQFQVFFDGVPYITGSYDVINNCFGGLTTAYCGFTASTGGATNTQTVCTPEPLNLPAGNETTVEAEICQGEQYFAGGTYQTTSGTYFDFFQAYNGCDSTIITQLTVNPISTTAISETICSGDCLTVGGIDYCNSGIYQQNLTNYLGCDSMVFINLLVLNPSAEIADPPDITCDNPVVILDGTASNPGPGMSYLWEGPGPGCFAGGVTAPQVGVTCPGVYTLTVTHTTGLVTCTATSTVTVDINVETIDVDIAEPDTIDCSTDCVLLDASGSSAGPQYNYSWSGPDNYTSNMLLPVVCDSGQYVLTIENPVNGCTGVGGITVVTSASDVESLAGSDQVLNCLQPEVTLDGSGSSSGPGVIYQWYDAGGNILDADPTQVVDQTGTYILEVTDTETGCFALDTVEVGENFSTPIADAGSDQVLDCTGDPVTLDGTGSSGGPGINYNWLDPQGDPLGMMPTQIISDPGAYTLIVTNAQSGCADTAYVQVEPDQAAPVADAGPDQELTCVVNAVTLNGSNSTTGANIVYQWQDGQGNDLGNSLLLNVSDPDTYALIVLNTQNNCVDTAEVLVDQNIMLPQIDAGPDTLLNCFFPTVDIGDPSGDPAWDYSWLDSGGNGIGNDPILPVDLPGDYIVQVLDPANGCTYSDTVSVTDDGLAPEALVNPPAILNCINSEITLDGSNSSQGADIDLQWLDPLGQPIGNQLQQLVDNPGDYSLLVTDTGNGCADTVSVTVSQDLTIPDLDAGPDTLLNCYAPVIDLEGVTTLPPGSYDLEWLDGSGMPIGTDPELPIDQVGLYILTITDQNNGCSNTDSVSVAADFDTPQADAGTAQVIDCISGSVDLDGSGSDTGPDLLLEWFNDNGLNAGSDPVISVSEAGTYSLVVTNQISGCADTSEVQVTLDADVPVSDAGPNGLLTCTIGAITLDGSSSSTGPDIEQNWYDEQGMLLGQGSTLDVSTPGIYTLQVVNTQNGCLSGSNVNVAIDTLAPTSDPGPDVVLNCLQPNALLESGSIDPAYEYLWTDDMGMPVSDSSSLNVISGGTFQLSVLDTGNGCSSTSEVMVIEDLDVPTAEAGPSLFLNCNQPQGDLDGSGSSSGPDITYTWYDNMGNIVGQNAMLSDPPEGLFTLEVLDTGNGCSATDDVIVSVDFIIPSAEAGPDQLLNCYQTEDTLSAIGSAVGPDYQLEWLDAQGNSLSADLTLPVNAAGTYFVEVTDIQNGCVGVDSIMVSEDFVQPTAIAGSDVTLNCYDPTAVLNGNNSSVGPDFSYNWTDENGQSLGTDLIQAVGTAGTIVLTVTDNTNGCSTQDSVVIDEDFALPQADAGSDAVLDCLDPSVSLDGSGSSSGPEFGYAWTDASGDLLGTDDMLFTNVGGQFVLTVLNMANGCSTSDTVLVSVDQEYPVAVLNVADILTCIQLTATLNATGTDGGTEYDLIWSSLTGGVITQTTDPFMPTVSEPGIYQLIVQNTINGCADTVQASVDQDVVPPVANAGADLHLNCFMEDGTLDGSGSSPAGLLSYEWTGDVSGNPASSSVGVDQPGTYSLEVTNTQNGCTDMDEVSVTASFLEEIVVSTESPPCPDQAGSLAVESVSGGTGPYLYSIDGGETYFTGSDFADLQTGVYAVVVQDSEGCTLEEVAEVSPPLEIIVLLETEAMLGLGETYQLAAATNFPANEIASISWTPATGLSCTDCLTPEASPSETTDYTIVVENANGCFAEATVRLVVDKSARIFIPNIFSPDFDGINDQFTIFADPGSLDEIRSLRVFDRWGEPVFSTFNIPPNDLTLGWDGTYRGQPVNPGVYVWFAELVFPDGRVELVKGDVTVVK